MSSKRSKKAKNRRAVSPAGSKRRGAARKPVAEEAEVAEVAEVAEAAEAAGEPEDAEAAGEPEAAEAAGEPEAAEVAEAAEAAEPEEAGEAVEAAGEAEVVEAAAGDGTSAEEGDEDGEAIEVFDLRRTVESLLFAADKPLTIGNLQQLIGMRIDKKDIVVALGEIQTDFEDRGLVLHEVAGGYQFRTHPKSSRWVQKLIAGRPVRLSRAQLDTLAIIAYRQPVTRPEIDEIRGVDSGSTLRVLMERNLIRVLGKKEEPGRPILYGTSRDFLEFFNLSDLRELPTLREFHELTEDSLREAERRGVDLAGDDGSTAAEGAPEGEQSDTPQGGEASAPEDVEASAPEDVEASAPEDVEAGAPEDVEAALASDAEPASDDDLGEPDASEGEGAAVAEDLDPNLVATGDVGPEDSEQGSTQM